MKTYKTFLNTVFLPLKHLFISYMRISWHNRMVKVGRDIWRALCSSRLAQSRTISRCILNITSDGDFTTSPGNLCQCSVACLYSVHIHTHILLFYRYFISIDIYLTYVFMRKYMFYLCVCLQHALYMFSCPLIKNK